MLVRISSGGRYKDIHVDAQGSSGVSRAYFLREDDEINLVKPMLVECSFSVEFSTRLDCHLEFAPS